jgi:hypothetical protein
LPVGSFGTLINGNPTEPGMSMILWDKLMCKIPMYNSEIEVVK